MNGRREPPTQPADEQAEIRRRLDAALLAGEVGTFEWDVVEDRMWGDANFARIFGIRLDETGAAPLADYLAALHPDDRDPVMQRVQLTLDTGRDYEAEYRIINGGETRWLIVRGKVEKDDTGRIVRFPGVVVDVTARRQAEEALHQSETRYRALFDALDEGFCVLEVIFDGDTAVDYRFLEMNPAFEQHTGLHDAVGRTARELLPDLEEHWFRIYGDVARTGKSARFESGSAVMQRWFDVFAFRIGDAGSRKVALLFTETSEQKRAQEELAASRERLRAVLENSLDAAYRRNLRTDSYDYLSPVVEQVMGIDVDSMQRMPVAALLERMHPDDRDHVQLAIDEAARRGRGRIQYRFRMDDGEYRWLADHFTVQTDDAGEPVSRTGIVRDISEQKRIETELQLAKEEAEQASQVKSQFMAVMSHELRTPLSGVIGFADLLANEVLGPMTERQQDALERMKASSWHLIGVIDEILTFSRTEAGKEEVHLGDADVATIARDVARIVEPEADRRGLRLECTGVDAPLVIRTDPGKVRQILVNLVGNAVKYTPAGSVTVELDRTSDDGVRVHVHDTGPGIAAEDHERIFEPFIQVDSSYTRGESGTGLGLAICRRLARLLGGDVTVASEPGAGSRFTLELPAPQL